MPFFSSESHRESSVSLDQEIISYYEQLGEGSEKDVENMLIVYPDSDISSESSSDASASNSPVRASATLPKAESTYVPDVDFSETPLEAEVTRILLLECGLAPRDNSDSIRPKLDAVSPPSLCSPLTRVPKQKLYAISPFESDDDDNGGESDYCPSEDEYVPIEDNFKKRRARATCSTSPKSTPPRSKPSKKPRSSPPVRNLPVSPNVDVEEATELKYKSDPWACPFCPWVQRNKRAPDLKRHVRTHTNPSEFVCEGVPKNRLGGRTVGPHSVSIEREGVTYVGGCGKRFSRRDALKRHVDNGNIGCL